MTEWWKINSIYLHRKRKVNTNQRLVWIMELSMKMSWKIKSMCCLKNRSWKTFSEKAISNRWHLGPPNDEEFNLPAPPEKFKKGKYDLAKLLIVIRRPRSKSSIWIMVGDQIYLGVAWKMDRETTFSSSKTY